MNKIALLTSLVLMSGWNGEFGASFWVVLAITLVSGYSVAKELCYE